MKLFNEDYAVYGKYAVIIIKYSGNGSAEAAAAKKDSSSPKHWIISNGQDGFEQHKLFSTYIDCLYTAAAIGFALHRKVVDTGTLNRSDRANILLSAWQRRSNEFMRLWQLMILTDKDLQISKDERLRKAFDEVPDDKASDEMNYFMQFVYGGLEEMDEKLSDVSSYKELADFSSKAVLDCVGDTN